MCGTPPPDILTWGLESLTCLSLFRVISARPSSASWSPRHLCRTCQCPRLARGMVTLVATGSSARNTLSPAWQAAASPPPAERGDRLVGAVGVAANVRLPRASRGHLQGMRALARSQGACAPGVPAPTSAGLAETGTRASERRGYAKCRTARQNCDPSVPPIRPGKPPKLEIISRMSGRGQVIQDAPHVGNDRLLFGTYVTTGVRRWLDEHPSDHRGPGRRLAWQRPAHCRTWRHDRVPRSWQDDFSGNATRRSPKRLTKRRSASGFSVSARRYGTFGIGGRHGGADTARVLRASSGVPRTSASVA